MPQIQPRAAILVACSAGLLLARGHGQHRDRPGPRSEAGCREKSHREPVLTGDKLRGPKGFKVDLLYTVPRESQGSWVNLAVDPKGRLIASDQYGKLYRVTPPPLDSKPGEEPKVEPITVEIGEAQGLLWAFDSLYVVVNTGGKFPSGLYRVSDTNGDDALDKRRTAPQARRIGRTRSPLR